MGIPRTPCTGDWLFSVRALHSAVCGRRRHRSLCRGQQRHPAPTADVEAGGGSVLAPVPRQQSGQPHHIRCFPAAHPVLPHLVHHLQLLQAGQCRIFSF